jgi:hypothetical protein
MDWFDHYLDGLSEGTNVVYPPDTNTWRPVKPTKQQQSLMQDSIIADMIRMRMIQEERAKLEEHGGGFYDSAAIQPKTSEFVFVDPLPEVSNDDAYIRMNGWCSGGNGVGGNSERVLRPNHPQFQLPEEINVNGRLAYYTEIGGEKIIYNDTLNRWELLAMWYGNGHPDNPLLGIGTGSNIPYPFYATWRTYVDPVFGAGIESIEKVAVGTAKAPDPGPPCA